MFPLVEPRQRPERFLLNRFSPLAESAAFLGLGGFDAAGSVWYPDARRLLGGVPNDGTLTNMDPATDWVRSPELGRWALDADKSTRNQFVTLPVGKPPIDSPLTLSAWIACDASDSSGAQILNNQVVNCRLFQFRLDASGVLRLIVFSGGSENIQAYGSTNLIGTGWKHVVGTYDPSDRKARVYVDGRLEGTSPALASPAFQYPQADGYPRIFAGGGETGNAWFDGRAADVLIHFGLLSHAILANPADPMLGGLILPPHRMSFPAAVAEEPSGFKPYWARPSYQIIGGGIA